MDIMFFLLALIGKALSQECYTFNCDSTETLGECSSYEGKVVTQAPCELGLDCGIYDFSGSCSMYPTHTRLPGEYCTTSDDCLVSKCYFNNACSGHLKSVLCSYSQECAPGLFCSNGSCQPQLPVGSSCNFTEQCVNSANCDNNLCVEYFSLAIGKATNVVMPPNFYPSCSTGYANTSETGFVCDTAPVSTNVGASCTVPSQCMAADGVNYKFCQCGLDGKGHCPLFEGDQTVVSLISALKNLISVSGKNVCNTSRRFSYACYVAFDNPTLLEAFLNYQQYAELYFNDVSTKVLNSNTCQQQVNIPDYYNIMNQLKGTAPKCPVYYTQDFEVGEGEICVWNNKNIFNSLLATSTMLFYCNSTSVCSATPGKNGYCVTNTVDNGYPGQNCTFGFNCHSGICTGGMCQGVTENGACDDSRDCNAGLYCSNNVCKLAAALGESCVSTPCQSTLECDLGVCENYYSKQTGAHTGIVSENYAPVCVSGFAVTNSSGSYCENAPTSANPGTSCEIGSMCMDTSGKYSKPCVCGFDGNGYCSAFEGDSYLQNAIKSLTKINSVKCNQELKISAGCFERSLLNLLEYYYYESNMTMYKALPYFQGNGNSRIVHTYYPEYYNALAQIRIILNELYPNDDSSSSSSSSSSFGKIFGVSAILTLINLV